MDATELQSLNERFGIPGQVNLVAGEGGLATVKVSNDLGQGAVTLAGGHVTSYRPAGQAVDVLWMSPNSAHVVGKAMRGGIPLCWPWFAAHPTQPAVMPGHGFARTSLWSMSGSRALPDGSTEVRMTLSDTPATLALWPHPFRLELVAVFGSTLRVDLIVQNPGDEAFTYTGALHTYFRVGDVGQIKLHGLHGVDYLDKVEQFARKRQSGEVTFTGQTDRIYLDTTGDCVIKDPLLERKIRVAKEGSRTTVVWNPWELAAKLPDVGAGAQQAFVCVETANAASDVVTVNPGKEAHLAAIISVD